MRYRIERLNAAGAWIPAVNPSEVLGDLARRNAAELNTYYTRRAAEVVLDMLEGLEPRAVFRIREVP